MKAEMGKPESATNIVEHLEHVDYPVICKKFSEACNTCQTFLKKIKCGLKVTLTWIKLTCPLMR